MKTFSAKFDYGYFIAGKEKIGISRIVHIRRPAYFLLIEDEAGLVQTTIFRPVYEGYGHILHQTSAYLLEGCVEQDRRRGSSFLVERISDLADALEGGEVAVPEQHIVLSSGAFLKAARRGRRAG